MTKICGIYKILNKVNRKVYNGKSRDIKRRWQKHKYQLKNNNHRNSHLQNAWNKYGEKSFEFSILKDCLPKELKYWEEYYINLYESYDREKGYNIRKISNGNEFHSEETKQRLREINIGKKLSKETKKKLSEKWKGKNNPMYGKKGELSHLYGKHHSEETKKKIGESKKGENNYNVKLTLEQVYEIRQKYIPRIYSFRKLAKEYNVNHGTIWSIVKNQSWKE